MRQEMAPMQQPFQPSGFGGDALNINQRNMDVEFQKHILDVHPLQLAFYKVFSGWREVTYVDEIEVLGKKKQKVITSVEIDRYSRLMNESGSNYAFNSVAPLITPASSTSHVKVMDIYNFWHGGLLPVRSTLCESFHFTTYMCTDVSNMVSDNRIPNMVEPSGCTFITGSIKKLRQHQRVEGHDDYIPVFNPYEINGERWSEIVTKLADLAIVTMKAKEGFTMKELAENYFTASMIRNGIQPPQMQQQPGILARGLGAMFGQRQQQQV